MTTFTNRTLDELCDQTIFLTDPKRQPERKFWYVDISAVDNVSKRIVSPHQVKGKLASVRARQLLCTHDVIVATTRPNLNAVALVPKQYNDELCSTGFCVLRAGAELDPEYLYYFVQSESFIKPLIDLTQGALYPAVTDRQVRAQSIPWINTNEQRHIARHLKKQLIEVETARTALKTQLQELTKLANAIIANSISKKSTKSHLLGTVLEEIKQGIGENWSDFPTLGATRNGLAPAKEQPGKLAHKYKPAFPGTVFYNPMRILIGSIAFVDEEDTAGITSPDYVVLKGKPGKVDSRWFYYWLRSPLGVKCINSLARGAVRERMLFNRLAEGEIDLPDYTIQEEASLVLNALNPLRERIEKNLQDIDLLPQKILAQAFEPQVNDHA